MNDPQYVWRPGTADAPVLVLLHGTGGQSQDLLPLARMVSPSASVLAPAGTVSEHGAARWFRRLAEGVADPEDVHQRAHELAEFLHRARERCGLTGGRMIAIGFSNGANMAAALAVLRPDVLTEAVLFASVLPVPRLPDHDLSRTRVLLSNGQHDPIALPSGGRDLVAALRRRGADVTEHWHSGEHRITRDGVRRAAGWAHG